MSEYDYDFFVIGGGSGGVRAARMAKAAGVEKVGIAEEYRYGGTCVIRGCVPKKLFVYASHFGEDFEDGAGFGWSVEGASFDWKTLIANKDKEIDRLNGIYLKLLENSGVDIHSDRAEFIDAHSLKVGDKTITADKILIATGGAPFKPNLPGVEHAITSNEAFHLEDLPKRVIVVGGGYIAVEFAGIFNGLGSDVTQIIRGDKILRGFDEDVRNMLTDEMGKKGVNIRDGLTIEKIEKTGDALEVSLSNGETVTVDCVMYATGRYPNSVGLGLEDIGVALDKKGAVIVDDYHKTNVDNIYAVGDVIDKVALTPVAIKEAMNLTQTLWHDNPVKMDYADIPTAVFSQPPVGTVGLSQEEALAKYGSLDVYASNFKPMKHTLSGRDERTWMKLLVDSASQKVVGVHMVGLDSAEIIQAIGIAIKMGATKQDFDNTVALHPSAAEEFVTMRDKKVITA